MPESPLQQTPYEVLGVPATADEEQLRRAYRRMLRETHPDAGGDAARFHAVQRAWELIGTPAARAAYDGTGRPSESRADYAPRSAAARAGSRPQTRMHGHPGGWLRERFLDRLSEWVGRGQAIADPYDPALLRSAPRGIRRLLASAIAEEETSRLLAALGIGFTVWNDVAAAADGGPPSGWALGLPDGPPISEVDKLDHVVLGPTGLWALLSEDWGAEVTVRRGEITGRGLDPGERPVHALAERARRFGRQVRAKVSALVVVVPDRDAPAGVVPLGSVRGMPALLVQRSRLPELLRTGIEGVGTGGTDLFELRARVNGAVRYV